MFANRYTAFVDACALVGVLKRNMLLTLAEEGFFRIRWSAEVLDEVERAVDEIHAAKGNSNSAAVARNQRERMESAFEEAPVTGYEALKAVCTGVPDPNDHHVVAAALKAQAATIVTDNLKDFPQGVLADLNIEAKSTDAFIADTIELDPGRAVGAIRRMRERFKNPALNAEALLLKIEAVGLTETADTLRSYLSVL
ncbi:PIN domain-containing protein [Novosphingobium percolationis]|uniref:PIN domain-containing protein n=1 Tax=Novosphingobium percolationis TaxID=2871811 RepID=UPI001CD24BBC|nr:PIN domain-containing protein [Novosphingobium percolationis]